ncbi:MAG: HAMP domain-containing protein [Lachnospiraceae bacterium]|nr:HAMP domain-containing protein [Lachnospiraceae bacterium]
MDGNKKSRFGVQDSIKKQFALIFMLVLAGTILLCFLINQFCLQRFYIHNKKQVLLRTYHTIAENVHGNQLMSEAFQLELEKLIGRYNLDILVMNEYAVPLLYTTSDVDLLKVQFFELALGLYGGTVLEKEEEELYQIERVTEQASGMDYIVMWGFFDPKDMFLIRTPIVGIEDSVQIANRFLMYSGLAGVLLGGVIIWVVTRKVTAPIRELSELSERMSRLDFDARYTGKEQNEIGKLGMNINQMSDALERTISELKTANNELRRDIAVKEELEAQRKEFLSNVSHELKTPIALIQGYAEGLQEGIDEDAEGRAYYCGVIIDEANKMNRMVKQLMTLDQLESGQNVTTLERFDIVALVNNYVQSADILVRQYNAEVSVEQRGALYVWGDEFKVEEVVMNYFTNALNHLNEEKKIEIRFLEEEERHVVRVTIFNTGSPIPEESLSYLWDKFYKVDKARTREYGGSGVGLSIVRAIMNTMHQGYGVNNYDNGVEFWFELERA